MMKNLVLIAGLVMLTACASTGPKKDPASVAAQKALADCLGREVPKAAKTDATVEAAADAAIAACSDYRAKLGEAVTAADGNTAHVADGMAKYDARTRADAVAYITELRR